MIKYSMSGYKYNDHLQSTQQNLCHQNASCGTGDFQACMFLLYKD